MILNLQEITLKVVDLAQKTGQFINDQCGKLKSENIEIKDTDNNLVTFVDKTSEQMLVAGLETILPLAGFIAEEGTSTKRHDTYNWIIDPLDGTTNFIHQLAPFAISIGLAQNDIIILGVVFEVNRNECFYAWKNGGAWLNGSPISVSTANTVSKSLIATGFPYNDYDKLPGVMKSIEYLVAHSHGIRRLGSAATDLVYVACGRLDAFFEYALNPWDVAAGSLIVLEAGGFVSDFSGGNNYLHGKEIVATNSNIKIEFLDVMNQFLS